MTETIFEKIGGEKSVNLAVDIFYRRVLSDPKVATFFESTNMDDQRAKQKSFLTMVFGGPNAYTGKDLRTAHKPLVDRGLNDTHFNIVIEHLEGTLRAWRIQLSYQTSCRDRGDNAQRRAVPG